MPSGKTPEKTNEKICCSPALLPAVVVMAGLLIAGWFVKGGLTAFRTDDRVVSVKGLSERNVEADLAIWMMSHSTTGNALGDVQGEIERNQKAVMAYFKAAGLSEDEIDIEPLRVQDLLAQSYRPENIDKGRYIITQGVTLRTSDMEKMAKVVSGLSVLLKQNVIVSGNQPPVYVFTGLNEIKPEMLAEAVTNARTSAAEFAKDSGERVAGIKQAYQGVFQILPRDPVSHISEQNQRFKRVRVVSTVDFYID